MITRKGQRDKVREWVLLFQIIKIALKSTSIAKRNTSVKMNTKVTFDWSNFEQEFELFNHLFGICEAVRQLRHCGKSLSKMASQRFIGQLMGFSEKHV